MGLTELSGESKAGLAWWTSISESEQEYWLSIAQSGSPVDAWTAYMRSGQCERDFLNRSEITNDEQKGMEWWNSLSRNDRRYWIDQAGSARPVDCWNVYKVKEIVIPYYFENRKESEADNSPDQS